MINALKQARCTVKGKVLLTVGAIAGAVALPQVVHLIGAAAGVGTALGELLLPMHFFVLLAGLFAGPFVGVATGAFAPLISMLLSGMPKETVLPFMMIELIGYGLIAGLVREVRLNAFGKLFAAQLGGRILRAIAVLVAVYLLDLQAIGVASIWITVKNGLLGIVLQWSMIPLLLFRLKSGENQDV